MEFSKISSMLSVLVLIISVSLNSTVVYAGDTKDNDTSAVSDPLEGVNRTIFGFNSFLDKILIKPVAKGYQAVIPELARKGVRNFLNNISEPVTFVNSILQGDVKQSFTTFWRFALNTSFGIGGIFDVAKDAGLQYRREDFGQTQGVYGFGQGAYLMLPLLGPSNARDLFGKVVDSFADPFGYILTSGELIGRAGLVGLDARESTLGLVDHIEKTSLDPYATIRSLYTQKRWDDIRNGR